MSGPPVRRETIVPSSPAPHDRPATREFIAFGLAGERFALPLAAVREILKVMTITEVPRAASHVLGILAVRGRITTVIDLRRRLRMPSSSLTRASRILLADGGSEIVGMMVDEVHQVHRLHEDEIELAAVVAGDLSEYVFGIGRPGTHLATDRSGDDDILILLDPVSLLRKQ